MPAGLSRRTALLLLAAALLLCAAARGWLIEHLCVVAPDGVVYIQGAQLWARSPADAVTRNVLHPGFPALTAWTHQLLTALGTPPGPDAWVLAGQCVAALGSLAALAGVYVFTAQAIGRHTGLLAVLLLGMGRKFAWISADALTDAPALALEIWAVVAAIRVTRRMQHLCPGTLAAAASAGMLLAGAYLIRPEGAFVLVPITAVWIVAVLRGRAKLSAAVACAAMMIAVFALCAGPYMAAIGGFTRKWALEQFVSISRGSLPLAVGQGQPLIRAIYLTASGVIEQMHAAAGGLAGVWVVSLLLRKHLPEHFRILPTWDTACITAAWAAVFMPLVTVRTLGAPSSSRYLLLLAAMLMPTAATGTMVLVETALLIARRIKITWPPLRTLLLLIAGAAIAGGLASNSLRPIRPDKLSRRLTGRNLAHQLPKHAVVIARDPQTVFYARRRGDLLTDDALASRAHLAAFLAKNSPPDARIYIAVSPEQLAAVNPDAPAWLAELTGGPPTTLPADPENIRVIVYTLAPHD